MATPEHRLISRIVTSGELKEVLAYGITDDDFLNLQCKAVWGVLLNYFQSEATRGSVIPSDAFKNDFPHFDFVEAPATTTAALCHDLRMQRLTLQVREAAQRAVENSEDPLEAAAALKSAAEEILGSAKSEASDVRISTHLSEICEDYEKIEAGLIQPAIHWPWAPLDKEVGGVSNEDYVLLWGRPKSKKTFVMTYVAAHAYCEQGKRVLCYTKEMTPKNMLLRIAAFMGRLPYRETRLGELNATDRAILYDLKDFVRERAEATGGRNDLIVLSGRDAAGRDGATWLKTKIEQHKPDVCFVDGLYLLNDDRGSKKAADWQRIMNISRDVRQVILETQCPIIATMQANRSAAKNQAAELDEIAFADAVGQDITQGFRVINEKGAPTIALVAGGSREYQLHGVRINGTPCSDFSFHSIMSESEIENAHKNDSGGEPADARAHSKKRGANKKIAEQQVEKAFDAALARM